ncbi:MarR family winged helix-turn-helix transcriptional regulator [Streptomyces sp. DSM 44917]|uniref:MarR family winged helix-turn-helix transcriptional regulator n=1 Tax=Streptomyces boetiae TaxID=3075541 RepID=A0ABU2L931_9ACTN|nr:MarR family winged helix-turn-helix transcriptional regulator [Streptomyces sp. DSM 44917]MDT0308076.1 MarR family winged helix-turn-helix transcriptional regulator [Streptomyces sp. DSM 44917]
MTPESSSVTTVPALPDPERSAGPAPETDPEPGSGPAPDPGVLDALQHQAAVFARRAEQTRLGGVAPDRSTLDRAAYLLLSRLAQDGPTGVKALAAGMGIDSSTVTRQVAPLVDAGLVSRAQDPGDGRAVVLQLSAAGRERLAEVRSSRMDLMAALTEDWSPQERAAFCALLTRFNAAIGRRLAGADPEGRAARDPAGADGADGAGRR